MENFEIKTCGDCAIFKKNSCPWRIASEAYTIACAKFIEKNQTIVTESTETPTKKQPDLIINKKEKLNHSLISIYKINDKYVVAESIEDAIKLYKDAYESPYNEVKTVTLVEENAWIKSDKSTLTAYDIANEIASSYSPNIRIKNGDLIVEANEKSE